MSGLPALLRFAAHGGSLMTRLRPSAPGCLLARGNTRPECDSQARTSLPNDASPQRTPHDWTHFMNSQTAQDTGFSCPPTVLPWRPPWRSIAPTRPAPTDAYPPAARDLVGLLIAALSCAGSARADPLAMPRPYYALFGDGLAPVLRDVLGKDAVAPLLRAASTVSGRRCATGSRPSDAGQTPIRKTRRPGTGRTIR